MKIKEINIQNFGGFNDITVKVNDKLTKLVGLNGAGKTTVGLTAIWACLKGIADSTKNGQLKGKRFQFIGNNAKTAKLSLTIFDDKEGVNIFVTNKISKSGNEIKFIAEDGRALPESWLNDFFNVAFMSAKNFSELSSKDQALTLGIDVSSFDYKLKKQKEISKYSRAAVVALGEVEATEKAEEVLISDLLQKRNDIIYFNDEQKNRSAVLQQHENAVISLEKDIKGLYEEIEIIKERIQLLEAKRKASLSEVDELPKPEPLKDLADIDDLIANAEKTNAQARSYQAYIKWLEDKEKAQKDLDLSLNEESEIKTARLDYIKSHNFGFQHLSVNESGELIFKGREIRSPHFSKGELEMIVAGLHASLNPNFKFRFIDDFELLDNNNQAKLLNNLIEKGFQVLVAEVGDEKKGDNSILLKDCSIAEELGQEENQETLL